jgi:uncharacterized protein (DUF1330 family)
VRADIEPSEDQLRRLAEDSHDGAIVMVNLLKFRANADYAANAPEAKERLTGRQAYQRYGMVALAGVVKVGGRVVWGGKQRFVAVGGSEQDRDEIVCLRYPSRRAFLAMVSDPEYRKGLYHRDAALERTALLCCDAGMASES